MQVLYILPVLSVPKRSNQTARPNHASTRSDSESTMTFDKTRAMRNAERYLSQGKIRSAIGEYEQVIKYDSKDFGTINMLGDLYSKSTDIQAAIRCYTAVADHYGKQGFAQKAIAVYNKISRLDPNSTEVWLKLAELHKQRGSLSEARMHYKKVAEKYENVGRKIDALAVWKEIALLDPTNTDSYLSLAESYMAESQPDEAHDAYFEAGKRFAQKGCHKEALECYSKAIGIKRDDIRVLEEFVASQFELGQPGAAAERLKELLEEFPHSREIRFLLVDCLIKAGDIFEAEQVTIRLVEMEPANYPKFLELARIYVDREDLTSATRILSMSSEHMLVGGQAEEFHALIEAVLVREPDQLEGLRLKARYCSWQRDESALCDALARLAEVARNADSVEDERNALIQLTMLRPQEAEYADRLRELNLEHGFEHSDDESLFDKRFSKPARRSPQALPEEYVRPDEAQPVMPAAEDPAHNTGVVTVSATDFAFGPVDAAKAQGSTDSEEPADDKVSDPKLEKEIDGIKFYIENGYLELAEKAANELLQEFGPKDEITQLVQEIRLRLGKSADETSPIPEPSVQHVAETDEAVPSTNPFIRGDRDEQQTRVVEIEDLRSELGLDDNADTSSADFETHFNTATAYQEMGLIEEAIKEYQFAVSLVKVNDGTRRFFSCANLLGHCFMQQGMPKPASKWFERTLETEGLSTDEKLGIWYELGSAFEADGELEVASKYFEQVYAENVDFRDVSERIKSLVVNS